MIQSSDIEKDDKTIELVVKNYEEIEIFLSKLETENTSEKNNSLIKNIKDNLINYKGNDDDENKRELNFQRKQQAFEKAKKLNSRQGGEIERYTNSDYFLMNVSDPETLVPFVTRACEIKKKIVEIDEKERGLRRILNFGHTLGHAFEAESDYTIPHGGAVSMGMTGALILSEKLGHLPVSDRERIMGFLQRAGMPVRIPMNLSTEGVISRMQRDKKKEGKVVHFVLLRRPGMPFVNGGIPVSLIRETIEGLKK